MVCNCLTLTNCAKELFKSHHAPLLMTPLICWSLWLQELPAHPRSAATVPGWSHPLEIPQQPQGSGNHELQATTETRLPGEWGRKKELKNSTNPKLWEKYKPSLPEPMVGHVSCSERANHSFGERITTRKNKWTTGGINRYVSLESAQWEVLFPCIRPINHASPVLQTC